MKQLTFQAGEAWKGAYDSDFEYAACWVIQDPTGLSVYRSLKDGNVGHELTDTEWWVVIIDLSTIKTEADRIAAINTAVAEAETLRVLREEARVSNEAGRQSNEETRVSNEQTRQANEQTRESSESERVTHETTRTENETERCSSEETRQQMEQARQAAESDRQIAENNRAGAEEDRVSEEQTRQANEQTRQANEQTRESRESERVTHETTRTENETTRCNNEETRQSQEQTRQSQEQAREQGEANRNSQYETAEANRGAQYTTAERSRDTLYQTAEGNRNTQYSTAEGNRNTQYSAAEGNRDTQYQAAEENRDNQYEEQEGSPSASTAGDGSRWGDYKAQESRRDLLIDCILGTRQWAGCRWRKDSATPEGEPCGSLAKLECLPELLGLGGYLVKNDHSRRKLSAENHNLYVGGAAASLAGDEGHYQWGWNTTIYYATWEDDTYIYEAIDTKPIPGQYNYIIPPGSRSCAGCATIDRETGALVSFVNSDARYRGGNNDSAKDELFNSQLGMPATVMSVANFDVAAKKNGTLWFANERVMFFITAAIKRIIFHNRNIQAAVNSELTADGLRQGGTGSGISLPANWAGDWGYYPYLPLNAGVELGDLTGIFSKTIVDSGGDREITGIPSFFGLKNDYKYLGAMCGDVLLNCADGAQEVYISNDIDGTTFNLGSISGKVLAGTTPVSSGWSFISKLNLANLVMFPIEIGASASTGYADGYYNPHINSGLRGAYCLGDANHGGGAGSACLVGDVAPSYAYAYWGACLCEFEKAFSTLPTLYT